MLSQTHQGRVARVGRVRAPLVPVQGAILVEIVARRGTRRSGPWSCRCCSRHDRHNRRLPCRSGCRKARRWRSSWSRRGPLAPCWRPQPGRGLCSDWGRRGRCSRPRPGCRRAPLLSPAFRVPPFSTMMFFAQKLTCAALRLRFYEFQRAVWAEDVDVGVHIGPGSHRWCRACRSSGPAGCSAHPSVGRPNSDASGKSCRRRSSSARAAPLVSMAAASPNRIPVNRTILRFSLRVTGGEMHDGDPLGLLIA